MTKRLKIRELIPQKVNILGNIQLDFAKISGNVLGASDNESAKVQAPISSCKNCQ
ncbi:MAG: hypothetical protein H0V01_06475 [Bacteroidetes bacterium]|nr:hypothetical protein [Bacteroidota bacterium]HET6243825.1 hypothetical protein [Bacteroidia bacterium]